MNNEMLINNNIVEMELPGLRCSGVSVRRDDGSLYSLTGNVSEWKMPNPPREMLLELIRHGWTPYSLDYVGQRRLLGDTTENIRRALGLSGASAPVVIATVAATEEDARSAWPAFGLFELGRLAPFTVPTRRKLVPTNLSTVESTSPRWTGDIGATIAHEQSCAADNVTSWITFEERE